MKLKILLENNALTKDKIQDILEDFVNEGAEFKNLKKNKIPLTPEERKECMNRKAVWHHGLHGEPSPAVWKSVNPKTKETTYITNTHRAWNKAPSLKGASFFCMHSTM